MFRSTAVLALLVVSAATANVPPAWHSKHGWKVVFEFPDEGGVEWSIRYRLDHGARVHEYPSKGEGLRTFTLNSPNDFTRHESGPIPQLTINAISPHGEMRTLDVKLPRSIVHKLDSRTVDFIRYRVEWTPDGIRLTELEKRHEWGLVVLAYIFAGVSVIDVGVIWLCMRRQRRRLTRTNPPVRL